jgi:serine/threonine protein kinase
MQGKILVNSVAQEKTMLYCPRCKREYEEGTQRFCVVDGGRLISKSAAAPGGIFTKLAEKAQATNEADEILSLPNFVPVSNKVVEAPVADNPAKAAKPVKPVEAPEAPSFIRETQPDPQPDPQPERPSNTFTDPFGGSLTESVSSEGGGMGADAEADKPTGKQVTMSELPSFQAALGDRKTNPTGRMALSWENPNVLLGHVIRGRYFIERRLSIDDVCITYLGQDRAASGKKIIFKVLAPGSDFILSSGEERVALSHLNHPHIVKILDSGEMPEGMPFAVFEYVEGGSLRELLDSGDPIPVADTARIAKQMSEALSGAQQNGVLHYDVRPQKVILKPEADGTTIAKVTDFSLAKGYKAPSVRKLKDVAYQSPEQLQARELSPASESYSLAAIAYEMLTGRLPYNFTTMRELLDAQKRGLQTMPRMVIPELPSTVDEIFARALAFDPDKRYQKARDFGEAIYNALGNSTINSADEVLLIDDDVTTRDYPRQTPKAEEVLELQQPEVKAERATPVVAVREKQLAEPTEGMSIWAIATIALVAVLIVGGLVAYYNFSGPQNTPAVEQPVDNGPTGATDANTQGQLPNTNPVDNPAPREIAPPPNSTRFHNSAETTAPGLKKNFRGFAVFYPKDWKKNPSTKNFLDISKPSESGLPIEQMLVSWYESKGIFDEDNASFANLAMTVSDNWSKEIPNFQVVSQGETTINNGRRAYEVKFQGETEIEGKKTAIWGRTLFLPAGRYGVKNGLIITMLATSNSADVLSVDDVGNKGDLKEILYSFEPDPLDNAS